MRELCKRDTRVAEIWSTYESAPQHVEVSAIWLESLWVRTKITNLFLDHLSPPFFWSRWIDEHL